ncbi:MAG: RNA polymerase sigma factor [Mangrovibacterium sp.]
MQEKELAERCRKGEEKALKILYGEYSPLAMGIAMRYLGDEQRARDVVHDSFVKILLSINRFNYRGAGALKAWISRIVVNVAITSLRKEIHYIDTDEIQLEAEEQELSVYESVSDSDIVQAVGELPKRLGVVFNMFLFENMPHVEIAKELGITESASRVRLHRAKDLVATALKSKLEEDGR